MSEPERFYITTAIDYANGDPHLGHAFEKIGADAIVRYLRLKNVPVRFSIGMQQTGVEGQGSVENRSPGVHRGLFLSISP